MHLLIIEDSNRLGIEQTLGEILSQDSHYSVVGCTADALELMNLLPIDVVLLDFTFCEESFLTECRRHVPALPLVFVVDDPFLKPFQQLKASGHACLSQSALGTEAMTVLEQVVDTRSIPGDLPQRGRRFQFELDNDKSRITTVVELLLDVCQSMQVCSEADRFRIGIALEEALVNAIVHGNLEVGSELRERGDDSYEQLIAARQSDPRYATRRVTFAGDISATEARFVIRDQGPGFDVSKLPDPTDPAYLERPCGRGLLLMRSFMSDVIYNDQGNEVTLIRRNLSPAVIEEEVETAPCEHSI